MTHYHTHDGMAGGYLPDSTHRHETQEEAITYLQSEIVRIKDEGAREDSSEKAYTSGVVYYNFLGGPLRYIEYALCNYDCEEDPDD